MTLLGAILKKVQSNDAIKYPSPPPELDIKPKKKKRRVNKFADVVCAVDSRPPRLLARCCPPAGAAHARALQHQNMRLLMAIRKNHFTGGRVDCWWRRALPRSEQYYAARVDFLARLQRDNRALLHIIQTTGPRITPTAELEREWARVRRELRRRTRGACALLPLRAPPDPVFAPPPAVSRPRVTLSLGFRQGARLGELPLELFTDVCPRTCELFLELLRGDGLGHCYVGTCFYRKVPGLYWSGGDVTRDCGLGCYAPRGRRAPPPAENYHYPHSAPGLLTMHVTRDDEVCGTFSITFKPLPQFDLRSVVFGRVVLPSRTYEGMRELGAPLSTRPVIEICAAKC